MSNAVAWRASYSIISPAPGTLSMAVRPKLCCSTPLVNSAPFARRSSMVASRSSHMSEISWWGCVDHEGSSPEAGLRHRGDRITGLFDPRLGASPTPSGDPLNSRRAF